MNRVFSLGLRAVAGAVLAMAVTAPAFATTALEGTMFLQGTSNIGSPALATDTKTSADSWTGPVPSDLSVAVRATAQLGDQSVVTHATESASWASANSGAIRVSDFGHEFNVSDGSINQVESLLQGGVGDAADWSYAFRATGDGVFRMDFDVTGRGDSLFGLGAWDLEFVGDGLEFFTLSQGFRGESDPSDIEHIGSFSHDLTDGVTYRVSLINRNSLGSFTPNHESAAMDADFNWSITSGTVPEPSTWALSIVGFGLAGSALRRRTQTVAA